MNLDIEGTKHEKVVIIVLAYVMGFTAGFICFGISTNRSAVGGTDSPAAVQALFAPEQISADTLISTPEPTETTAEIATNPEAAHGPATVTYTDGKLQAQVGDNSYLLSMRTSGLDSAAQSAFKNQGAHQDIPAYTVSPNGKFIHFCEQQSADDSCMNFIFDVEKNVINYVSIDGKKVTTTGSIAKAATWSENGLTLDNKTSADAAAPALLLNN